MAGNWKFCGKVDFGLDGKWRVMGTLDRGYEPTWSKSWSVSCCPVPLHSAVKTSSSASSSKPTSEGSILSGNGWCVWLAEDDHGQLSRIHSAMSCHNDRALALLGYNRQKAKAASFVGAVGRGIDGAEVLSTMFCRISILGGVNDWLGEVEWMKAISRGIGSTQAENYFWRLTYWSPKISGPGLKKVGCGIPRKLLKFLTLKGCIFCGSWVLNLAFS